MAEDYQGEPERLRVLADIPDEELIAIWHHTLNDALRHERYNLHVAAELMEAEVLTRMDKGDSAP